MFRQGNTTDLERQSDLLWSCAIKYQAFPPPLKHTVFLVVYFCYYSVNFYYIGQVG